MKVWLLVFNVCMQNHLGCYVAIVSMHPTQAECETYRSGAEYCVRDEMGKG